MARNRRVKVARRHADTTNIPTGARPVLHQAPHRKKGIMCAQYQRWSCLPSDLVDLTPKRVRDLIVECFFEAQHEMMEQQQAAVGLEADPVAIRMGAESAVRMAFASTGGDFENPDKASLERAVNALAEMASTFGTPADIVHHHEEQIAVLLSGLRR